MNTKNIFVAELNNEVISNTQNFILSCENAYKSQMEKIVEHIKLNPEIKFILLAGPSSSGKTTTAKLLAQNLAKANLNAKTISLDDFFVERENTPLWPDGKPNYESVDSIDWQLFDNCMHNLLTQGYSVMPTYDFIIGKKHFENNLTLGKNDIVIIEGLHSLNTIIDNFISTNLSVKVYLAPSINYFKNEEVILDGINLRFIRRLIRDVHTRGASPLKTLNEWESVRMGEKLYIDPFKNTAQFTVNTCHPYEVCVYKNIIKRLKLDEIDELKQRIYPFESFVTLENDVVPNDSLLKEFVH